MSTAAHCCLLLQVSVRYCFLRNSSVHHSTIPSTDFASDLSAPDLLLLHCTLLILDAFWLPVLLANVPFPIKHSCPDPSSAVALPHQAQLPFPIKHNLLEASAASNAALNSGKWNKCAGLLCIDLRQSLWLERGACNCNIRKSAESCHLHKSCCMTSDLYDLCCIVLAYISVAM